MLNQANFTFFEKSTKSPSELTSSNLFHQLLIPQKNIVLIDAFGTEIVSVPKGHSALIYPLLHYQVDVNCSDPAVIHLLSINDKVFESYLFSSDFFSQINQVIKRSDVAVLLIDEETTQLLRPIYKKISNEFQFEWMIATLEILHTIAASPAKVIHATTDNEKYLSFYNQVNEYICENISHSIEVKAIAAHFYLSESTFAHRFREIFQTSFHHYLIIKKIEKSCEMLKYTADSIQEIGHALGFNSTSHFISSFKQIKEITPGRYRKKDRN